MDNGQKERGLDCWALMAILQLAAREPLLQNANNRPLTALNGNWKYVINSLWVERKGANFERRIQKESLLRAPSVLS